MIGPRRLVAAERREEDVTEAPMRPQRLDEFIGQAQARANLEDRDVLFIDEIHRLNPAIEEILYPAMEDFQLDLIIGEGPAARSVKIDLSKFTLVAATTRLGLLTTPLRDRFGIPIRLNFYTPEELELIVKRGARVLGLGM